MITEWQEAAVNARLAMRATQQAALQTLHGARDNDTVDSDSLLTLALAALREVTRFAVALKPHRPPRIPSGIIQGDAEGRVLRVSVGEGG